MKPLQSQSLACFKKQVKVVLCVEELLFHEQHNLLFWCVLITHSWAAKQLALYKITQKRIERRTPECLEMLIYCGSLFLAHELKLGLRSKSSVRPVLFTETALSTYSNDPQNFKTNLRFQALRTEKNLQQYFFSSRRLGFDEILICYTFFPTLFNFQLFFQHLKKGVMTTSQVTLSFIWTWTRKFKSSMRKLTIPAYAVGRRFIRPSEVPPTISINL